MSTDRSLATLLRALQSPSTSPDDAGRLLNSATTLLTLLTNPLNLSLLTSHLLTAPAIWNASSASNGDPRISLRVLTTFYTAANHVLHRESQLAPNRDGFLAAEGLPKEDWVRAAVNGLDDKSSRWKHLLVLGGILSGFETHGKRGLSSRLRRNIESAVVTATNLSLQAAPESSSLDRVSILVVLSHTFGLLSLQERSYLDLHRLLPAVLECTYFSKEGLNTGYFLGIMDQDIVQDHSSKFLWLQRSASHYNVQKMATGPLVSALGSLSKIIAFCVESVVDLSAVLDALDRLLEFSRSIKVQWRQNKLSELDASEEDQFLTIETLQQTLPMLWQVLKSTMFSIVVALSALTSRVIRDPKLSISQGPDIALRSLHTLRNLYFISSRLGQNSFSQFDFVFNVCIDLLAKYPSSAEDFVLEIQPIEPGHVPTHPYDRYLDLFFLNATEHLTLQLSATTNEELLLNVASAYLGLEADARLGEMFEAAHSVVLAVFATPQNFEVTARQLPSYIDTLFQVFPSRLSARQFRLAIKTLVRITSPPFQISETQPLLPIALLEMVRHRSINTASTTLLQSPSPPSEEPLPLSEQAVLVLAIIDALPSLSLESLEEWLLLTAETLWSVQDEMMREQCKRRFWEVLTNGEMDMVRAEFCAIWWHTRGGKSFVLRGVPPLPKDDKGPFMSGALGELAKL